MTWHSAAHQRDKTQLYTPEGRHQFFPTGSLHKTLNQPNPPGGRHQKQEKLQECRLQKGDHKNRKSDKMRQQRNMLQLKEQGKKPTRTAKWIGDRNSTWKKIQNNYSKDDSKISEKEWRHSFRIYKKCLTRDRRFKEQANRGTEMNKTQSLKYKIH